MPWYIHMCYLSVKAGICIIEIPWIVFFFYFIYIDRRWYLVYHLAHLLVHCQYTELLHRRFKCKYVVHPFRAKNTKVSDSMRLEIFHRAIYEQNIEVWKTAMEHCQHMSPWVICKICFSFVSGRNCLPTFDQSMCFASLSIWQREIVLLVCYSEPTSKPNSI